MYKRILVAVDGSVPSLCGLQEAVRVAKSTGATLKLVHVVDLSLPYAAEMPIYLDKISESLNAAGRKILAGCKATVTKAEIPCEEALIESAAGDLAGQLVREARAWHADLMVMGTHGRRGLRRLAMGSDAELVLRQAPVPVLLVRDQPEGPR